MTTSSRTGDPVSRYEPGPERERAGAWQDGGHFDAALAGHCHQMIRGDGVVVPLAPGRWDDDANDDDRWILDRCSGPTLDLGCGPGRLVVALAARGVPALGVDLSPHAVARCHQRGATVLRRDALGPLPHEGRWDHVVLADGNIGIGGDPVSLLRRCRSLLARGGSVIVELQPEIGLWQGLARLDDPLELPPPEQAPPDRRHRQRHNDTPADPRRAAHVRPWFAWATVGTSAVDTVAARAGLKVIARTATPDRTRCFAELT